MRMGNQIHDESMSLNEDMQKPIALHIDLNVSPREICDFVSVCTICRSEITSGRREATEEEKRNWKCFRCLLKNDGASSSGGAAAGFDINASPPREAEEDHMAARLGGSMIEVFSHSSLWHPINSRAAINSSSFRSEHMLHKLHSDGNLRVVCRRSAIDGGGQAIHFNPSSNPSQIPNMLYLQILREQIAERKGVLGEGWRVEFEFCNKRFKTSAVYVAPDGSRLKSIEDVSNHLGLPSIHNAEQNFSTYSTDQIHRMLEPKIKDGFPIQFQDFYLISAGDIDPRPSYHSTNQIWPVGYKCSWHDKISGSLFVFDVADGGDCGPIFTVKRFPCAMHPIPVGSAILFRTSSSRNHGDDCMGLEESARFHPVDDDDTNSIVTLLDEQSPPCLDYGVSTSKREDTSCSPEENSSNSNLECQLSRAGHSTGKLGLPGTIGEFQVESRSSSSVWEMVSNAFVCACREMYKQNGSVTFSCGHDIYEMNNENLYDVESLPRYSYFCGPINIPRLIQNENDSNMTCEYLSTWLKQDRFGFDVDFVQEVIEQLPGVTACSEYINLKDRKHNSSLKSVGSGFFRVEQRSNSAFGTSTRCRLQSGGIEECLTRDPCPPGNPLKTSLPSYLIGDTLQAWELAWRFSEVLGFQNSFSFQDLESELESSWFDCYSLNSGFIDADIRDVVLLRSDKFSQDRVSCHGKCAGHLLSNLFGSLLKILVSEMLSKVTAYAYPSFDGGESKSARGRKKDLNCLAALKKTKLDVPVNELTWPEIARRYLLCVLSVDGNPDSPDIASRESRNVFHCLHGDGGILCGSLCGVSALEGDAIILADAVKEINCPLKSKNEIVGEIESEPEADGTRAIEEDGVTPEWALVLEPVRKLPTNVGARIRKCVNEALLKNPPEWARQILEHSISKEVYKGNASGPTKKAVISVLAKVTTEIPQPPKARNIEKVKNTVTLTDLIMKQCRIVLRQAAAIDEDRVFCNLLGRATLNRTDTDEEGLLGYPGMISRPLDFRTIDMRLAAGSYDGSHEAFIDDVREVCHNICTAYGNRSDLIDLVENLSQMFEELYEKEVLTLVNKIAEFSSISVVNADAVKGREELIADVMKSSLPIAPWDEGICKICGMDRDDDNVLLCDRCDSEYHRYCLNPPLLKIPKGHWFCPPCVTGRSFTATNGSTANRLRKNGDVGEFEWKYLDSLARLAKLMETREYWEFSLEERTFFMKFLFDEALNSATLRDHLSQCASRPTDLQNKLLSLTDALQIQKCKEETLMSKSNSGVCNVLGDLKSDASSSLVNAENSSKPPNALSQSQYQQLGRDHSRNESIPDPAQICTNTDRRSINDQKDPRPGSFRTLARLILGHNLSASTGDHVREHAPSSSIHESHDASSCQDNILTLGTVRNAISDLSGSIASVESELLKVSLRKDFLGRDSNGRTYWAFHWPGARPWIIANGSLSLSSENTCFEGFTSIPDPNEWMSYEFDCEVDRLVGWLDENNPMEKELKESIAHFRGNTLKDSYYAEKHVLSKGISSIKRKDISSEFPATKAMAVLVKKFGPCLQNLTSEVIRDYGLYRCDCLEPSWPSKNHCSSCHRSFPTSEELRQHYVENCKIALSINKTNQTTEDFSKKKRQRHLASHEKQPVTADTNPISDSRKQSGGGTGFAELPRESDCPFKLEEIMSRLVIQNSVKDSVREIGLLGSGGVPTFLPNTFTNLNDPALRLGPVGRNKVSMAEMSAYLTSLQQQSSNESNAPDSVPDNKESNRLSRYVDNGWFQEGSSAERTKVKDRSSEIGISKSSIIHESSLKPLVGTASEILRLLKTNLLDMDAALPEDALRKSRSDQDKRSAWRAFVKSARTIYEMVQATVVLEDAMKREHLHGDWWYWSSPSAAAKINTLSALALRIYAFDSAISYEMPFPFPNGTTEILDPKVTKKKDAPLNANTVNLGDLNRQLQMTPESEPADLPRSRSRESKRRKS